MKRVIIVHRWGFGIEADWRPWLKAELEKQGYQVSLPEMPDIDAPVIGKWVSKLAEVVGKPDKDTFFIGHSIGCQAILRYLDSYDFKPRETVGGAIFVAGWFNLENLEDDESKQTAEPWIKTPINSDKIKAVLPKSTVLLSNNDPYGAFQENIKRFKEIGTKVRVMHAAGHLSEENGFTVLPMLLSEFNKLHE